MRKIICSFLAITLLFANVFSIQALDLPFEGNENEWTNFCAQKDLNGNDQAKCDQFINYMAGKSNDLEEQLNKLEKDMLVAQKNIQEYAEKIKNYQSEIDVLQADINRLNIEIDTKNEEIATKEKEINENQQEVDHLYATFQQRMVEQQSTMRLNTMIDFLMGATTFENLIRRSNGIKAITDYEQHLKDSLKQLIKKLEVDKEDLNRIKDELQVQKDEVVEKQLEIIIKRKEAEEVKNYYQQQEAELEALGNKISGDLEVLKDQLKEIMDDINDIPSSSSFHRPISGGYISAGTWHYPNGGLHLGMDFASSKGTPVYAAGNGVVVSSVNGCGDGYLGARCGAQFGGTNGGGNQIYLMTNINGSVYGLRYLHLLINTLVPTGTIVSKGDKIAELGTSGNSTGPHVHVEVIYLGEGDLIDYVTNWDGSLSFGAGFGNAALGRLCENGSGAPCRVKPETVFN